ncbi:discoidin domain-containing protein [Paenibacillus pasadenensis]|uniref:discoidin domain-containing protein n=1 Tax=Paenibacillus pasadenensis TaxID=217090 RepID=UPI00203F9F6F|nr:discoidin domain-containing protein [Paenibacillus pasadenensis]MCM3748736.1 discoidin domain-containing protein [Paenibacillus pasadenensis]
MRIGDPLVLPGSEVILASGTVPFSANTWHNLKLVFSNTNIKAYIDNSLVADVNDTTYSAGLVALGSGWKIAQYDNISIKASAPTIVNLALNKPVSADSEETSKGNIAPNGNDDDSSSKWTANDGAANHWWKVDLGSAQQLIGTEVRWESNSAYKYKIDVSNDNAAWTTVVDQTANTVSKQTNKDSFTASGRYVKITVTGLAVNKWASFYDFKVFGETGPNPGAFFHGWPHIVRVIME